VERRSFLSLAPALGSLGWLKSQPYSAFSTREKWTKTLDFICEPVLQAFENGRLVKTLDRPELPRKDRLKFASLEAMARILYPLVQIKKDKNLWTENLKLAFENALKEGHPDSFNWNNGDQPLVDAAILAAGFLQNPVVFESIFTDQMRAGLISGWRKALTIKPYESNWLLFAAMVEVALQKWDKPFKPDSITYAIQKHESWYKGDGWYGDGPHFHFDYYNSIIIHPFLLLLGKFGKCTNEEKEKHILRANRLAVSLERMVDKEGGFPAIGRSLCYRSGLFHHLAFMASESLLNQEISYGKIRNALDLIIQKTLSPMSNGKPEPEVADASTGLLRPGLFSFNPKLAENYINTASLYLATWAFLPLSLEINHPFWSEGLTLNSAQLSEKENGLDIDKALKDN
jgi:hypothetical protein